MGESMVKGKSQVNGLTEREYGMNEARNAAG